MTSANWFAVDWGTSNLRIWAMAADNSVLEEITSDKGMGDLTPDQFEPVFIELVSRHLDTDTVKDVVVCGMAGARTGWIEAPYCTTPCAPVGPEVATPSVADKRINVRILPGLCQHNPPDVMRGEETQIAGLLVSNPDFEGVVCMPGTHSKWARVAQGQVETFNTILTGELFALLSEQSILRLSMSDAWDQDEFVASVSEAFLQAEEIAAMLFSIRAASLIDVDGFSSPRARLSGLLIGQELAAMRDRWEGEPVSLIGASKLSALYRDALLHLGGSVVVTDATRLTLDGLIAAKERITRTGNSK